jgi:hypothetical protein
MSMTLVDYVAVGLLLLLTYVWIQNTRDDEAVILKLVLKKALIFTEAIVFMIFSKDNKGVGPKKNPDPDSYKSKPVKGTKRIVFLRHGESDWNNVFNKGINPRMIKSLFSSLIWEFNHYASVNSVFIDSPLNGEGIEQAVELSKFLVSQEAMLVQPERVTKILKIIRGDPGEKSIIVSSSLRRAVSTTTLGLWPRIEKSKEKIHLLSCLQEISRNIDTFQLSPPQGIADLPFERLYSHCGGKDNFNPSAIYDTSANYGNKTYSFYGIKRLQAFCDWVFQQKDVDTIIVGGHSLWFKHFFQTYLPHNFNHDAKTKKLTNSGIVAFELHVHDLDNSEEGFRIDPDSLTTVYGGYTTK